MGVRSMWGKSKYLGSAGMGGSSVCSTRLLLRGPRSSSICQGSRGSRGAEKGAGRRRCEYVSQKACASCLPLRYDEGSCSCHGSASSLGLSRSREDFE